MTTQDASSKFEIQGNYCRSNIFRSKSDSALWRRNDERLKLNQSLKDSIDTIVSFDDNKSTTNIPDKKHKTHHYQLSNSENRFSYNSKSLDDQSSWHVSLSLPAIPLNLSSTRDEANNAEDDKHVHKVCNNEKETFNQPGEMKRPLLDLEFKVNKNVIDICQNNPPKDSRNDSKEQIMASYASKVEQPFVETVDTQLQANINKTVNETNQSEENLSKQNQSNSALMLNVHTRNNSISRSTLANDSKLVKMSLLTNPINIMQSNVQLLNKSRNFLNFITEKSTNIMEKALLPQHLVMKYNPVSKTVETNTAVVCANNDFSLRNTVCKSDTDLTINSHNALGVMSCATNHSKSEDKLDSTAHSRGAINPSTCLKTNTIYENETVLNEKTYVSEKNDVGGLNYNIIDGRAKFESALAEINENRSNIHTEKSHNDKEDSFDIYNLTDSGMSKYGPLEHPLYLMLLEDYTALKIKHSKLLERMEYLEKLNQLDKSSKEVQTDCPSHVKYSEETVNKSLADLNALLVSQETLKNECTAINKEKENMIMKYVSSEKQLIDSQRYKFVFSIKVNLILRDCYVTYVSFCMII